MEMELELTANENAEKHPDHEVVNSHADHNADYGDVFRRTDPLPGVPECFFDKIDTQDEDQCPDDHNGYKTWSVHFLV